MSRSIRTVLADHNAGPGLRKAFATLKRPVKVLLTSDVEGLSHLSDDDDILIRARKHKLYVVTEDEDFTTKSLSPCSQSHFANRTVLHMPSSLMDSKAKTLDEAWSMVGWKVVRAHPLLKVFADKAILFKCDKHTYIEVKQYIYKNRKNEQH
jgi:hypothetical protein